MWGQIEWMKDRRHRIASRKGEEYECGWTLTVVSGAYFAAVGWDGYGACGTASYPSGVRPAFKVLYPLQKIQLQNQGCRKKNELKI